MIISYLDNSKHFQNDNLWKTKFKYILSLKTQNLYLCSIRKYFHTVHYFLFRNNDLSIIFILYVKSVICTGSSSLI